MSNPLGYNKVTIFGGNVNGGTLYDYVWIKDNIADSTLIDTVNAYTYAPTWDGHTILLAPFSENINGGNISSVDGNIDSWLIYRKDPTDSILTFLASIPPDQHSFIDYNIRNGGEYQYIVFPQTSTTIGSPMTDSKYTTANWNGWILIGLEETSTDNLYYADTDNIWKFDINLSSSDLTQNLNTYVYENFTKFPKISVGEQNYITGGLNAMIGNIQYIDGVPIYIDTADMRRSFYNFIGNGKLKLLKDRKGSSWIVQTMSNEFGTKDYTTEQIVNVNFTFTQVEDADNVSVIENLALE